MKLLAPCDGVMLQLGFMVRQAATLPSENWLELAFTTSSSILGCRATVLLLNLASGSDSGVQSLT